MKGRGDICMCRLLCNDLERQIDFVRAVIALLRIEGIRYAFAHHETRIRFD